MEVQHARPPLPSSYLASEGVWAGEAPSGRDAAGTLLRLRRFRHEGIDFFLDLTVDGELEPYGHLLRPWARHVRVPMPPGVPPAAERVREAITTVERALDDGFFVYVHGASGIERTGTVIGCWLAHRRHHRGDPVARVEELRTAVPGRLRRSPSTPAARALVRTWPPYDGRSSLGAPPRLVGSTEGGSR